MTFDDKVSSLSDANTLRYRLNGDFVEENGSGLDLTVVESSGTAATFEPSIVPNLTGQSLETTQTTSARKNVGAVFTGTTGSLDLGLGADQASVFFAVQFRQISNGLEPVRFAPGADTFGPGIFYWELIGGFRAVNGGANVLELIDSPDLELDRTYYIGVSVDESSGPTNAARCFVDGAFVGTITFASTNGFLQVDTDVECPSTQSGAFKIQELIVFRGQALSDQDHLDLANEAKSDSGPETIVTDDLVSETLLSEQTVQDVTPITQIIAPNLESRTFISQQTAQDVTPPQIFIATPDLVSETEIQQQELTINGIVRVPTSDLVSATEIQTRGRINSFGTGIVLDRARDLALIQFDDKENFQSLLEIYVSEFALIDASYRRFDLAQFVATAVGVQLDGLGDWVGEPRNGRSDPVYRQAILFRVAINTGDGTPNQIIAAVRTATAAQCVQFLEQPPANYQIFTDGANVSLETLEFLNEISPAGVGPVQLVFSQNQSVSFAFSDDVQTVSGVRQVDTFDCPPERAGGFGILIDGMADTNLESGSATLNLQTGDRNEEVSFQTPLNDPRFGGFASVLIDG